MIGVEFPRFNGDALCAEADPEAFFPEKGGATRSAKALCDRCEIRLACLKWSLDTREKHGMWGGLSETKRRKLLSGTVAS